MARGHLRIYIGVATGVGKTCLLLAETERRASRGTDIMLGCLDPRGRPYTQAASSRVADVLVGASERAMPGTPLEAPVTLDVESVLRRAPAVVVIDDLETQNPPTSRHRQRWQDVEEILDAGIDVITATNIEHLESLADVVHDITHAPPSASVPDTFFRSADQIEIVDMDPEALRRRVAHGNVLGADDLDLQRSVYFRPESLAALRELALLWVADRVDADVRRHLQTRDTGERVETKTRVVVAMTNSPGGEELLRRGARLSDRLHGELIGVHVLSPGHPPTDESSFVSSRRTLHALGGRYVAIVGRDVAATLVAFARAENATHLVVGGSTPSRRGARCLRRSVVDHVLDISDGIDVHVIAALPAPGDARRKRTHSRTSARGPAPTGKRLAWMLAVLAAPSAAAVAQRVGGSAALPFELLFFVVLIATVAWTGGKAPAIGALAIGIGGAQLVASNNPATDGLGAHLVEIALFVTVATGAITLVTRLRQTEERLDHANQEGEALARLAGAAVLVGPEPLSRLVTEICHAFELTSVAVLTPTEHGWRTIAQAGRHAPRRPSEADMETQLNDGAVLVMTGDIDADDQRLLSAFVTQLRAAQRQADLEARAHDADAHRHANDLRDGLLMAVSHDLRTPLATIKLSAGSLACEDVQWDPSQVRELARVIEGDADQLNRLVGDVLDLSRLQGGALGVQMAPTDIAEVLTSAVATVPHRQGQIIATVTAPRPIAHADPALLERVIANLVGNAIAWSPEGKTVHVRAGVVAGGVEVRIADRGPGIPPSKRAVVFRPFQRLGDGNHANEKGLGLGLALSRGFMRAMGGEILVDDTPGGGTTMVLRLDRADTAAPVPSARHRVMATHGGR